jgi:hypothetical protein
MAIVNPIMDVDPNGDTFIILGGILSVHNGAVVFEDLANKHEL